MNGVLIIVLLIFLITIFRGWRRGALRILFSLVCFVVLIRLVSAISPYISNFLRNHTGLYESIETRLAESFAEQGGIFSGLLSGFGVSAAADWILKGITFLIALIAAAVVIWIIFRLIGLINRIPILKGINRVLGLFAGALQGYLMVCLLMLLVSLMSGTAMGLQMTENIEKNALLSFLYYHNVLLNLNMFS